MLNFPTIRSRPDRTYNAEAVFNDVDDDDDGEDDNDDDDDDDDIDNDDVDDDENYSASESY